MNFLKKNTKTIAGIIIGGILVGGITAYATYNYYASQVSYTKKDGTEVSVEEALNELYNIKQNYNDLEKELQEEISNNENNKSIVGSQILKQGINNIDVGFKPSLVILYWDTGLMYYYIEPKEHISECNNKVIYENGYLWTTNTGFEINIASPTYINRQVKYWVVM